MRNRKNRTVGRVATCAAMAVGLTALADVQVTIDPSVEKGPIRVMNAVNNGPQLTRSDQSRGNCAAYRAARFPYARTHDSINQVTSNGHTVDISAVFPNFDADENDPKNYDFTYTDLFLKTIIEAGTEPFFRLGQTIENGIKKYHTKPPKDFAKWARICEHVMAHYLEGWANGFTYDITYWEIWNEADAQPDATKERSCQWGGTKAQFFAFYEIAAKHLKKRFPNRKIGGPALGWRIDWAKDFLAYQKQAGTPLDFFSHHWYGRLGTVRSTKDGGRTHELAARCEEVRRLLDEAGFEKTESILNEWNYIKDWTANFPYSCATMSNEKGGAFVAAAICGCQDAPLDMLMYYDARPGTVFNGLFDFYTFKPRPAYYALLDWSFLRDLGTQVKTTVKHGNVRDEIVTAVAAKDAVGQMGLLLARYNENNGNTSVERITLRLANGVRFPESVRYYLTDSAARNTLMRQEASPDGSLTFVLEPNAFIYLEWKLPNDAVSRLTSPSSRSVMAAATTGFRSKRKGRDLTRRGERACACLRMYSAAMKCLRSGGLDQP